MLTLCVIIQSTQIDTIKEKNKTFLSVKLIFQEHWDLSDKLWEMFKDDAPYEELREFMPICRYSDERIRRHYPQILNMANLEERLARLLIDELEETGQ